MSRSQRAFPQDRNGRRQKKPMSRWASWTNRYRNRSLSSVSALIWRNLFIKVVHVLQSPRSFFSGLWVCMGNQVGHSARVKLDWYMDLGLLFFLWYLLHLCFFGTFFVPIQSTFERISIWPVTEKWKYRILVWALIWRSGHWSGIFRTIQSIQPSSNGVSERSMCRGWDR